MIFVATALLLLSGAGSGSVVGEMAASPQGKVTPVRVITTAQDFRGVVLRRGTHEVQVEDLQWGLNADDRMVVAYMKFVDEHGQTLVVDKRTSVKRTFASPSDMHGFYMSFGDLKQLVWVDRILFARDSDGCLVIRSFSGTKDGEKVGDGEVPAAAAAVYDVCKWHAVTVCASGTPICVPGCPSIGTCICGGSGNCNEFGSAVCDGPCPDNQDCNTGSGGGLKCKCRPI
jgi:hypothetical protein